VYLNALSLRYFRSYASCDLSLTGQPVVIFGRNGAGKTNILEAISLLTPGRGLRHAKKDDFSRKPDGLGWRVRTSLSNNHTIETGINLQKGEQQRSVMIDEVPARASSLGDLLRIIWLTPSMDRLWTEDPAGRRRFLDRMTLSFFPDHAHHSAVYEKALRSRNTLLKERQLDARWCMALEADMAISAEKIMLSRQKTITFIEKAQQESPTAFPVATLEIDDVCPPDLQTFWAETRRQDHAAGRTLAGPHRADLKAFYKTKGMPASNCSTGEQKALLISIVLANARALIDYSAIKPLVLLDEVSAHFDPVRRGELFDEICDLGIQAWMTGTEDIMFKEMRSRGQMIEVRDTDGHSVAVAA
jgi:DNA replication and repair protein RecF